MREASGNGFQASGKRKTRDLMPHGSRFSGRSSPSRMGPSICSRAASYSSRVPACRARSAIRPVRPVPPLAARMRQPRSRYARSNRGSAVPASSRLSSAACSASASSRDMVSSTGRPPCWLTVLLQVDAVLGYYHLEVVWGCAQVPPPLAVEDIRAAGVRPEHYSVLHQIEYGRVLREMPAPDGVPAVDRVARPERLHAGGGGVELLRDPVVVTPLLDPAPDLRCVDRKS